MSVGALQTARAYLKTQDLVGSESIIECKAINKIKEISKTVKVLIDTGSNVDLIQRNLVQDLNLETLQNQRTTIIGINGKSDSNEVVQCTLELPDKSEYSTKWIVMDFQSTCDLIIGTKTFWKLGLVITSDINGKMLITTDKELNDRMCCLTANEKSKESCEEKKGNERDTEIKNRFPQVFKRELGMPPKRGNDLRIELIKDAKPVALKPYRFPILQLEELRQQIVKI